MRLRKRVLAATLSAAMVFSCVPADFGGFATTANAAAVGDVQPPVAAEQIPYSKQVLVGATADAEYYLLYNETYDKVDPVEGVGYRVVKVPSASASSDVSPNETTDLNNAGDAVENVDYTVRWFLNEGVSPIKESGKLTYEDVVKAKGSGAEVAVPGENEKYKLQISVDEASQQADADITVSSWDTVAEVVSADLAPKNVYLSNDEEDDGYRSADLQSPTVTIDEEIYGCEYKWYHKNGEDWVESPSFSQTQTVRADTGSGEWRCVVSVKKGGSLAQVVIKNYNVIVLEKMPVKSVGAYYGKRAYIGQAVTVKPDIKLADNASTYTIEYKWTKRKAGADASEPAATTETLEIPSVTEDSFAEYTLTVSAKDKNSNEVVQEESDSFWLRERGPYKIKSTDNYQWSSPEPNEDNSKFTYKMWVNKALGEKLYLDVNLKPEDGWSLSYQWYRKEVAIGGATGSFYELSQVTADDFGDSYSCVVTAKNGAGQTYNKDTFVVHVSENPGIRLVTKTDTKSKNFVPEGVAFSLKASDYEASNNYALSYQWEKRSVDESGKTVWSPLSGKTGQSLDFSSITASDEGKYRCVVTAKRVAGTSTNNEVSLEETFTITVSPNLKVYRKSDETVKKNVGDKISLQVKAEVGSSDKYGLSYEWLKDGAKIDGAIADTLDKTLTKDDFGWYECKVTATGKNGATKTQVESCTFRVIKDTGFELKTDTNNTIYGKKVGETVTLSVNAVTGNATEYPLTYQWQKKAVGDYTPNEPEDIKNATGKDLNVTLKDDNDFAIYECIVSNKEETETVSFRIVKYDGFYARANGQTMFYKKVGDSVEFAVKAGVDGDTRITYQWYYSGWRPYDYDYDDNNYMSYSYPIAGANDATYKVDALKKGQFTTFACRVTDEFTKQQIWVSFSVQEDTGLKFLQKNEDLNGEGTNNFSADIYQGETVALGVTPVNPDNINLLYRWYFTAIECESGRLLDDATSELNITNIQKEQFGVYRLEIYKNDYNDESPIIYNYSINKRSDRVHVHAKNYVDNFRRALGSNVTFNVVADTDAKNGTLTYQWYKEDAAIYGETNASLTLASISESDYGEYRCIVTVGEGDDAVTDSVSFRLLKATALKVDWDIIDYSGNMAPKYINKNLGAKAEFAVTATADPEYTVAYQWYKDNNAIYNATTASYTIDSVTKDDYAEYWCKVTDGVVTETCKFVLTAEDKLKLTRDYRTTVEIKKGETAELSVSATCASGFNLSYQWYYLKNDGWEKIAGATNATYTTDVINFDYYDPVYYKCEVKTEVKKVEAEFDIVESGAFGIEVKANKDGAVAGSTVTYTAKVSNPDKLNLTYQWYKGNERGGYNKIAGATGLSYKAKMPGVKNVYDMQYYLCVGSSGENEDDDELRGSIGTLVVQKPSQMNKLPASTTKNGTNVQGYSVSKATALTVAFDSSRKLAGGTQLTVIDGNGIVGNYYGDDQYLGGLGKTTLSLKGNSAYFLFRVVGPDTTEDMAKTGYKVKTIKSTVAVKTTTKKLTLGAKEKYSVAVKGAKYSTNKKSVATVSSKGVITAKKTGSAKITVKTSKQTIVYNVTVKKAPKKITKVTPAKKTLKVKKSFTIKVKLPKGTASGKITYKSSNKKVATVNSKGKVTAKKKGKAKITVKTYNGKKKVVQVTVKKK